MGFVSVLSFAHKLVGERLHVGDWAIDATVGGGNDTLFLIKCVGDSGHIIGFDIQEEALDAARTRISSEGIETDRVTLVLESHERMAAHVSLQNQANVGAVMFNLGYLPGGDLSVITTSVTTIPAIEAALRLIRVGGIVTIVVYPGHSGGDVEAAAVTEWCEQLPQREFQVLIYRFVNRQTAAPYLIAVEKLSIHTTDRHNSNGMHYTRSHISTNR